MNKVIEGRGDEIRIENSIYPRPQRLDKCSEVIKGRSDGIKTENTIYLRLQRVNQCRESIKQKDDTIKAAWKGETRAEHPI